MALCRNSASGANHVCRNVWRMRLARAAHYFAAIKLHLRRFGEWESVVWFMKHACSWTHLQFTKLTLGGCFSLRRFCGEMLSQMLLSHSHRFACACFLHMAFGQKYNNSEPDSVYIQKYVFVASLWFFVRRLLFLRIQCAKRFTKQSRFKRCMQDIDIHDVG